MGQKRIAIICEMDRERELYAYVECTNEVLDAWRRRKNRECICISMSWIDQKIHFAFNLHNILCSSVVMMMMTTTRCRMMHAQFWLHQINAHYFVYSSVVSTLFFVFRLAHCIYKLRSICYIAAFVILRCIVCVIPLNVGVVASFQHVRKVYLRPNQFADILLNKLSLPIIHYVKV